VTLLAVCTAVSPSAHAIGYQLTDAVKMRSEPRAAAAYSGVAPKGSAIDVQCQQWAEAQGPNGNTLWLKVNGSGRSGWWVSDAWTTSPHKAADKTVGLPGVPLCTGSPPPPTDTPVWIGSPIDGFWTSSDYCPAGYPSSGCSLPTTHHTNFLGANAWSVDLQVTSGTPVYLYAAPKQSALDGRIFAKVEEAGPACRSGRTADGGSKVRIGLYLDKNTLIGQVVYAHIDVDPAVQAQVGKFLSSRWDVRLGTVGTYTRSKCWTGVHHHMEVVSSKSFACYNGGYVAAAGLNKSTAMKRSNYVGYIGGSFPGPRAACPNNI
jgi:hypothetical protein